MARPRYAVNVSTLFTERPLLQRPAAARAAGFDAVEMWWPFARAVPGDAEVEALVRAVTDAGVALVGLNTTAGDPASGERGLVSVPSRSQEFRDNVEAVVGIASRLGCRLSNALYGIRVEGVAAELQDELAVENLAFAGRAAARIGATMLVEPLSGAPDYPLRTARDAVDVVDRVRRETGVESVGFLCDLYHLAVNGEDLQAVVVEHAARVAHVQVADAPGRHEPGTGRLDLEGAVAALLAAGYDGRVSLEYVPSGRSEESFAWLPWSHRGTAGPSAP